MDRKIVDLSMSTMTETAYISQTDQWSLKWHTFLRLINDH